MSTENTTSPITFTSFNLPPALTQALDRMEYVHPTPVQAQAIPPALTGQDVLGSAQTGTGKTAAFCIPLIVKMLNDARTRAIIMAPTRELAAQTGAVLKQMIGGNRDIGLALLIGGESMGRQFDQLRRKPRIIVGTPGRINDHLRRAPTMLSGVDIVVLDEADRMLDMGFSVQIDSIIAKVEPKHQTLMFSATFPDSILKFARRYLNDPVRVAVSPERVTAENINHEVLNTSIETKYDDLVGQLAARNGTVIVFVRTKHGADKLTKRLEREGQDVAVIHGGLKQRQRDRVIQAFRDYKIRVLVATDVAARGLDVPHIEHVVNYDLPQNPEDYIHRIGRTARAGAKGNAVAFVLPAERGAWGEINRLLNPGMKAERDERKGSFKKKPGRGYRAGQNPWRHEKKERQAHNDDFFNEGGDRLVQLRYAEGDVNKKEGRPARPGRPFDHKAGNHRPGGPKKPNGGFRKGAAGGKSRPQGQARNQATQAPGRGKAKPAYKGPRRSKA